nr:chitinase [Gastrodia elata]
MAATSILVAALSALMFAASHAGEIAIYWGQDGNEGTLQEACETGNYGIVIISFLSTFGRGQDPKLNLAGHCDTTYGTCTSLSEGIRHCQSKSIKVFLSLGGDSSTYSLDSRKDADDLAAHIWDSYLGGRSDSRPLGEVVLDGVDFDMEQGSHDFYGYLATKLQEYSTHQRRVYLSAAPQCPYPDASLGGAIEIVGFDYVWIQFYNNPPCQFLEGQQDPARNLVESWMNKWAPNCKDAKLFLGLPASRGAAGSGFIPASDLISNVLPKIRETKSYGGVMLWSRSHDKIEQYSSQIKSAV